MAAGDKKKSTGKVRRRERKSIPRGQAHIQATFNNTIVTLTDPNGNVISWGRAGLQRLAQKYAVCGTGHCRGGSAQGYGAWTAPDRSLCQRSWLWSRGC